MEHTDNDLAADLTVRGSEAARTWHPDCRLVDLAPLTGGSSSLTFTAQARGHGDDIALVIKVAPPGLEPVHNRDVLRQGRVLRALHDQPGVLVPRVLFEDSGEPPEVPPFIAMELVAGECSEPLFEPRPPRLPVEQIRARAFDAARMLAALHRVRPEAVGLDDEPVIDVRSEIDRWTRAFETVTDDLRGDYLRCAEALHDTVPAGLAPVVTHGDYRLGNTLCEGERVTAIIDWEIWAVGDPRVDLSWFTFFTDEALHPSNASGEPSGMPTAAELLAAYVDAGASELPDLGWFDALTRYKESAATALLVKRARKRGDGGVLMEDTAKWLPKLVDEALSLLGRG